MKSTVQKNVLTYEGSNCHKINYCLIFSTKEDFAQEEKNELEICAHQPLMTRFS
jgi:hypothetical protein